MNSRIICDLAPTADNNRNSEGAFLERKDGSILFVYSRYGNEGHSDGAAADLYGMVSEDQGETFGEPFLLLKHQTVQADNVMSVSLMRMENGDMGLFYLKKTEGNQCCCYLIRSSDEGISWGESVRCIPERGYFVVNNDRVIRCKSGRLLIAAAYHPSEAKQDEDGKWVLKSTGPGVLKLFASDDDGRSWRTLPVEKEIPVSRGCKTGVQEPGLLQLADGSIWCFIRTDAGRQYEAFGDENGENWSQPLPSSFTSALSPLSAKRLKDGRLMAVWNPVPGYNGRQAGPEGFWNPGRTPLAVAFSADEGQSWSKPEPIEEDKQSGYCYTAIYETADGGVLLGYCAGGPADKCLLNRLRIRKLYLERGNFI